MQKISHNTLYKKIIARLEFQRDKILNSTQENFNNDSCKFFDSYSNKIYISDFINKKLPSEKSRIKVLIDKLSVEQLNDIQNLINECLWLSTCDYEEMKTIKYIASSQQLEEVNQVINIMKNPHANLDMITDDPLEQLKFKLMTGQINPDNIEFFGLDENK